MPPLRQRRRDDNEEDDLLETHELDICATLGQSLSTLARSSREQRAGDTSGRSCRCACGPHLNGGGPT